MTNGGGKHEKERMADLSQKLCVPLDASMIVQSHTPFRDLDEFIPYKEKCVLVVGGDGAKCREVAEAYGYKNVVTPGDIYAAHPEIWPFSKHFLDYYRSFARPLPKPVDPASPENSLKIDAIHVYNDPRDWGLDVQLIIDLLLSREGIMGTISAKNGNPSLENCGYQQDNQPKLYFSNPDIIWASKYALPRLGQGAFRRTVEETWRTVAVTPDGTSQTAPPVEKWPALGKPSRGAYRYAEERLKQHRKDILGLDPASLKTVFMIGDNPASDIRGANDYHMKGGVEWVSVLTKTGVYTGKLPSSEKYHPKHIVKDVAEAVALGLNYNGRAGARPKG
jgi:HAD superfamily hydrolase (TIGR01456 family)